mmetsp:Transcript_48810/g.72873  ORF Transcript_48810/g.72873 Transcript_48810/m.72873 type:complete len:237 (-) Transcript_48810:576-1286(-)
MGHGMIGCNWSTSIIVHLARNQVTFCKGPLRNFTDMQYKLSVQLYITNCHGSSSVTLDNRSCIKNLTTSFCIKGRLVQYDTNRTILGRNTRDESNVIFRLISTNKQCLGRTALQICIPYIFRCIIGWSNTLVGYQMCRLFRHQSHVLAGTTTLFGSIGCSAQVLFFLHMRFESFLIQHQSNFFCHEFCQIRWESKRSVQKVCIRTRKFAIHRLFRHFFKFDETLVQRPTKRFFFLL